MSNTVVRIRLAVLVLTSVFAIVVWLPMGGEASHRQPSPTSLRVTFFDVGQGDAVFIETPDGIQVLIDGGPDSTVLRRLSTELGWLDRTIDVVIRTHPDLDHVGGLVDVLQRYQVAAIITTEATGESTAAAAYEKEIAQEGAQVVYARAGQTLQLGASTSLHILAPARDPSLIESNAGSIITQLQFGDTRFMLTGDAPQGVEDYLVSAYGADLTSNVLKLGHHGSDTSSSQLFLNTVQPQYAIVSAAKDNRYGHPHPEVVKRTSQAGAQLLNTAELGSVTVYSDGQMVWLGN